MALMEPCLIRFIKDCSNPENIGVSKSIYLATLIFQQRTQKNVFGCVLQQKLLNKGTEHTIKPSPNV